MTSKNGIETKKDNKQIFSLSVYSYQILVGSNQSITGSYKPMQEVLAGIERQSVASRYFKLVKYN